MRLVDQAVNHLAQKEISSAAPFEAVLKALESAWSQQEKKIQARRDAEQKALLLAERREILAEKISANIRALPGIGQVPPDIMEFAAGPWADVVALAQSNNPNASDEDPGGYLAVVPLLFWSVQRELVGLEKARLVDAIPGLLAKLREGLNGIGQPSEVTNAFIENLVQMHQQVLETPVTGSPDFLPPAQESLPDAGGEGPEGIATAPLDVDLAADAPVVPAPTADDFVIGAWVDLVTGGKVMRTQLTWASPHNTLFLFTAADGSTQSMTRRMRDKLAAEGSLRLLPQQHVVDRAIDAMAGSNRTKRTSPPK
jgi:hypothetical protein